MTKENKGLVKTYIVCCSDLHAAVGAFSLDLALKVARQMTKDNADGCVYMPVPFYAVVPEKKEEEKPEWNRGMYL